MSICFDFRSIVWGVLDGFFTFDSGVSKRCKHICYLVLNSATDHTKEHLPLFLSQLWSYLSDEWIFILIFSQFHDTLRTGYLLTCSSPLCVIIEMASTWLGKKKKNPFLFVNQ